MPGLFSSPSQNASQAASATASADNAEIGQEEQYVNASEGNLRNAIAGLGPNPYFTNPNTPANVNPAATANFSAATPQSGSSSNLFAKPAQAAPTNLFAPAQRQAMPVARGAVAQ
jgi:hypothetical protein